MSFAREHGAVVVAEHQDGGAVIGNVVDGEGFVADDESQGAFVFLAECPTGNGFGFWDEFCDVGG